MPSVRVGLVLAVSSLSFLVLLVLAGCADIQYAYHGCAPGRWAALNDDTYRRCVQLEQQLADASAQRLRSAHVHD